MRSKNITLVLSLTLFLIHSIAFSQGKFEKQAIEHYQSNLDKYQLRTFDFNYYKKIKSTDVLKFLKPKPQRIILSPYITDFSSLKKTQHEEVLEVVASYSGFDLDIINSNPFPNLEKIDISGLTDVHKIKTLNLDGIMIIISRADMIKFPELKSDYPQLKANEQITLLDHRITSIDSDLLMDFPVINKLSLKIGVNVNSMGKVESIQIDQKVSEESKIAIKNYLTSALNYPLNSGPFYINLDLSL